MSLTAGTRKDRLAARWITVVYILVLFFFGWAGWLVYFFYLLLLTVLACYIYTGSPFY